MNDMPLSQFLFSFNGRISRSDMWLKWVLPYWAILIAFGIVGSALDDGTAAGIATQAGAAEMGPAETVVMILTFVFMFAAIWPGLAVTAKRWHDRGKSGWWTLIGLVPIVGGLWLLVECGFLKGTDGPNRFGADPVPMSGGAAPMAAE